MAVGSVLGWYSDYHIGSCFDHSLAVTVNQGDDVPHCHPSIQDTNLSAFLDCRLYKAGNARYTGINVHVTAGVSSLSWCQSPL